QSLFDEHVAVANAARFDFHAHPSSPRLRDSALDQFPISTRFADLRRLHFHTHNYSFELRISFRYLKVHLFNFPYSQGIGPSRSSSSIVESSSSIRAAAVFSSKCLTFEVPGIGSITGDFRSSHASAICAGWALRRFAARVSGPSCSASLPVASGNQGIKPRFSRVQYSSTSSEFLSTRLYRFWTDTIGVMRRTASICF